MSSISLILIFIIFVVSAYYVIQPFFGKDVSLVSEKEETYQALLLKKNVILQQIKELEMDQEIGNVDEADFQTARDALKKAAAQVLDSIKKAEQ